MLLAQHNFTANLVQALAFQQELPPKTALTNELLQVTTTLRELIAAGEDSDDDIITHYRNRKTELKTLILKFYHRSHHSNATGYWGRGGGGGGIGGRLMVAGFFPS